MMGTRQCLTCLVAVAALGRAVPWAGAPPGVEDLRSGASHANPLPIWHVPGEARGRAAADLQTAFFLSRRHEVLAIDARLGTVRWRASTGFGEEATSGPGVILAGPVIVAGDYDVIAFDRASGDFRWRFVPHVGYGAGIYLGSASNGLVFAGSPAGRLYAIDQITGEQRWSALVAEGANTTVFEPVTDGHIVAAGYTTFVAPNTGGVVVLDARTGRLQWRKAFPRSGDPPLASNWAGGPVISRDIIAATSGDGVIHGFSLATGSHRWTIPGLLGHTGVHSPTHDFRPLALSRETLVAGSLTGLVVAYDIRSQREQWRYSAPLGGAVMFNIASENETVYVPYITGQLVALRLFDGTERWRMSNGFTWTPARSSNRVIVAGSTTGFFGFQP